MLHRFAPEERDVYSSESDLEYKLQRSDMFDISLLTELEASRCLAL